MTGQVGFDFGLGKAPNPAWRPRVQRAGDLPCQECGEGRGFGWHGGVAVCYACFRDHERAGHQVVA